MHFRFELALKPSFYRYSFEKIVNVFAPFQPIGSYEAVLTRTHVNQPHGAQKHQKLPPENIDMQSFQEM